MELLFDKLENSMQAGTKNNILEQVFDFCFMIVGAKCYSVEALFEWKEQVIVDNFMRYVSPDLKKMAGIGMVLDVSAPMFNGQIVLGENGIINSVLLDVKKENFLYLRDWARLYLNQALVSGIKDYRWRKNMFGLFQSVNHRFGPYASFVHMPFSGYQLQFSSQ